MQKHDTLSGLFLLAISLAVCTGSVKLGVGTLHEPGSGFFPLASGLALGVFALLILYRAGSETRADSFWTSGANKRAIYLTLALLLLYAIILEPLGFIGSTIVLFLLFSRFVSGHRWKTSIFFAVAVSLATYFVFTLLLRAPLPGGVVERIF
ncbi:MAG: tripartite tricarboxylate transporter TctB family protein [Desulfobacteraceae bacterium]|nr:MAG: tripartite tricarboxylate transporter TctB family protein [Desulfobacteraceae bacterium]